MRERPNCGKNKIDAGVDPIEEREEAMKINHMALYVKDLEAAKVFFVKYFAASFCEKYYNQKTGFQSYFLTFEDGGRLEIMTKPGLIDKTEHVREALSVEEVEYMGFAHVAFSVGSKEKVDEMTQRLCTDGYQIIRGPRTTGDGYYESCVVGPEGNRIEIVV